MQPDYQRLVRNQTSRGLMRELGPGLGLLIAIVLGCLLLPEAPSESQGRAVGSAPPEPSFSMPQDDQARVSATEF